MSGRGDISEELGPYVDRHEAEAIDRLGERLIKERGTLSRGERVRLREHLATLAASGSTIRDAATTTDAAPIPQLAPRRLGLAVGGTIGSGLLLLGVAAVGLAGAGPLAF